MTKTSLVAAIVFVAGTTLAMADSHEPQCPADVKGNECEYFKDGYRAGEEDGSVGMSMAYERHADGYDSRFEPYYAMGYEAGWKKNR